MMKVRSLAVLGCLVVACVASPAIAEPAKIAIGYPPATDFLAVYVAKEKGFFAKHDIDATPTKLPVVTNIPSAIVSGSIQIGMTTVPVLLQAVDGGLDFVLIAGAAHHTKASPFISLLARKDVKIEKPADIVGKKVGVPGINSVIDVVFRKWLINNKVPVDQVKIIEAPLPQLPDLLKGGTLDLVAIVDPMRTRIIAGDIGYIAAEYVGEVDPDVLISAWMTTGDWAKNNPQVIKDFRAAIDEGLAFIKSNPDEAKEIEKKYLGFNSPRFPTFENKAKPDDLKVFISIGKELGLYRTALDPAKLVLP
jgi:ABC-type nitrate/sulfonate/bicarbonate transport systems, periplasmic components